MVEGQLKLAAPYVWARVLFAGRRRERLALATLRASARSGEREREGEEAQERTGAEEEAHERSVLAYEKQTGLRLA
jgi:hypothetical protein